MDEKLCGEKDAHLRWEKVSERHVVANEWIDLRESTWRFPDGQEAGPFYTYSRRSYVVIVATDAQGNYVCVRQFRQGIEDVTIEFPAGGIEEGEDPLEAARRELSEETGYTSDEWEMIAHMPSNATVADNYAYVCVAKNCRRTGVQHLDAIEFLEVELLSPETLRAMIRGDRFLQAVHVAAYYRALDRQGGSAE